MQETPASDGGAHERVRFVMETPELYGSDEVQAYVQREIERPSKAWVREVVESTRETEFVKLRTAEFVLLPDLNGHRRPPPRHPHPWPRPRLEERPLSAPAARRAFHRPPAPAPAPAPPPAPSHHAARRFNWLAIVADPGLRSVRDLRGEHLPMLERLYRQCVQAIQREYRVGSGDVMVFANYPPSVYKLHFHFCAPFFQPTAYDAFRMHSLSSIISNLQVHPDYYMLSTFQVPVHSNSDLYRAVVAGGGRAADSSGSSSSPSEGE
jgi:hypothetical protein